MTRLAWVTDPHLDHLGPRPKVRDAFAEMVADDSDCLVITGDIATQTTAHYLGYFAAAYKKPIYFVLGNHDFWGGSFTEAERYTRKLCRGFENLHWLTESDPIEICPGVEIVGVDGWYDAQFGDWQNSSFEMVDWTAIRDLNNLRREKTKAEMVKVFRAMAQRYADKLLWKLQKTTAARVFTATHIPPFEEVAMHNGRPSSPSTMPWYSSQASGYACRHNAAMNPAREFITLCGHVHSPAAFQEAPNHLVLCGASEYGAPGIAKVFEL